MGLSVSRLAPAVLVAAGVLMSAALHAAAEVEISGQVRVRSELDDREFDSDSASVSYTDLRTRVTLNARANNNVHAIVQFQDSRRLGGKSATGDYGSGSLANGRNVDVHQAFFQVDELWKGGPGIKAGRFEINIGDQRVFGAVGWHNVGRSWEGSSLFLKRPSFRLTGYQLLVRELETRQRCGDFLILGLSADIPSAGLEPFFFFESDENERVNGIATPVKALERASLGLHFARAYQRWSVTGNGVVQFGERRLKRGPRYSSQDISSFLVTLLVTYLAEPERMAQFGIGIDYASGDDDPADDTYSAYDNLYYTGHKFRGYMDYFVPSGDEGLIDLVLSGQGAPLEGWLLKGDVHYFRSAQKYLSFAGEQLVNDIGVEIDVTVSTTRVAGISLSGGVSVFFPSDSFVGPDGDPGVWLYNMGTFNFGT